MKTRGSFLLILVLATAFLFYRPCSPVAMAAEQMTEPEDEPAAEPETEPEDEPAVEPETEPEAEPVAEPEVEPEIEPAVEPEAEPTVEPESSVDLQAETYAAPVDLPEMESVSDGPALIEWLESHKNTGGSVKLADHVVLEGEYCYCPDGMNMPDVSVDTAQFTITVTGVAELMSDNHLIFSGQPEGKGIFYVAEKGMLSLQGVTVKSEACALWQEEGAGLVVAGCRTEGDIHYAQTPFVIDASPICAVVEQGRTVNEALPAEVSGDVNRQGRVDHGEQLAISWNLEGTETQQEERRRFQIQGCFSQAASAEPVLCTVIYNDYPLTFEEVSASAKGSSYIFKGWYTMSEEVSAFTLISEYSFDGENWLVSEESEANSTYGDFIIFVDEEQTGRAAHPYIYIRLQRNNNGTEYFSNVLRYAADNLDCVEDIGGSRGGGTSIVNPPDDPEEQPDDGTPEEDKPDTDNPDKETPDTGNPDKEAPDTGHSGENKPDVKTPTKKKPEAAKDQDTDSDNGGAQVSADMSRTSADNAASNEALPDDNAGQTPEAAPSGGAEQRQAVKSRNTGAEQPQTAESQSAGTEQRLQARTSGTDAAEAEESDDSGSLESAVSGQEKSVIAISAYSGDSAGRSQVSERTLRSDSRRANYFLVIAGFVLLSVLAGTAGFYVHSRYSRSGTNR